MSALLLPQELKEKKRNEKAADGEPLSAESPAKKKTVSGADEEDSFVIPFFIPPSLIQRSCIELDYHAQITRAHRGATRAKWIC